jgi:hypothetical protein
MIVIGLPGWNEVALGSELNGGNWSSGNYTENRDGGAVRCRQATVFLLRDITTPG